ncbi:MAG: T9SS type A sorting domain-containing protein [Bacteroidales bacterium]|nr:T9SS type A sorting domain-containing protein [Bacteroidales bacterium]
MKTITCFILLFSCVLFSTAQVTFIIDSLPDYTPPEDIIYIAGDFQGWNPGDPEFALQKNVEDKWFIELEAMPEGSTIEFKFTRGDWGKVEKGEFGEEIPNRQFTFGNGETVSIIIYNWADGGGGNSTAAENVYIVDEEFYMPQLDRYRRIWIYLPPDYDETQDHFPAIYMHDGQNLFDAYTSFAGEWEVDETLNDLYDQSFQVPIVVGIDNGGVERVNEYTPWPNPTYGGGQGDLYINFIIETLKPFIDENYRTLPGRESTAIWGSSLGGLISHYGALKHQDIFSKAGIYSPSYWFSDSVWTFTHETGHQFDMKLYQMTGSLEGGSMVPDTWAMHDTLTLLGFDDTQLSTTINIGEHNEQLWREDFETAYLWLFHSFAIGMDEHHKVFPLILSPNPVSDRITLQGHINGEIKQLTIYGLSGIKVYHSDISVATIDVSAFAPGTYILEITTGSSIYRGKFTKIK